MKYGLVTLAFNEERFIEPFLRHIPDWVDKKIVLVSTKPWQGEPEPRDYTADIAREMGATVVENYWPTEESQRNTGQDLCSDCDWVIVLDPDEFLTAEAWDELRDFDKDQEAYVPYVQRTYWKDGFVIDPPEDYKQIVLVKPNVRFVDKRVVNTGYGFLPIELHHFSWARTDDEVWKKISHYSHANEFDKEAWFTDIWSSNRRENLHPLTPQSLKEAIPAILPPELEKLKLWP